MSDWRIIEGDCIEVMRSLPAESVDLVVADPPYATTSLGWDQRVRGWPAEARRLLKPVGSVWSFGTLKSHIETADCFAGWTLAEDVIWEKQNGSGSAADRFRRVHEQAARWYPSDRPWGCIYSQPPVTLDARKRSVYRRTGPAQWGAIAPHRYESEEGGPRIMRSVIYARSCHRKGFKHETPKPEEILAPLIEEACPPDGLVLDPFCGSGATGRAALLTGRRFLGIELDPMKAMGARAVPGQRGLSLASPPSSGREG